MTVRCGQRGHDERGPENVLGVTFGQAFQDPRDRIFAACPAAASDKQVLFDRVRVSVMGAAMRLGGDTFSGGPDKTLFRMFWWDP
jgi:hypothetical protein